MRLKLFNLWDGLRSSFWFLPAVMALAAALLSVLMISLDTRLDPASLDDIRWLYLNGPDGARALLSTVAGSMITVAGVVFSITMVVLSLTSSQFGPRLLGNFMRDRGNQVVLGTFIATYVYCLLVLRTVRSGDEIVFVPHLSVALAVLLAALSVGVLIYFIHHTAESIQVATIVSRVSGDLQHIVRSRFEEAPLFPEQLGQGSGEQSPERVLERLEHEPSWFISAQRSGYLQTVGDAELLELAEEHDLVLRLLHTPGKFVIEGSPLMTVWSAKAPDDNLAAALCAQVSLGVSRNQSRDLDFLFDQLVEMALRALSPALNDPFTAMQCVDRIAQGLALLAARELPSPYRYSKAGALRVFAPVIDVSKLASSTLGAIRRNGASLLIMNLHLLSTIGQLSSMTNNPSLRTALLKEAKLILEGGKQHLGKTDYQTLQVAYEQATDLSDSEQAKLVS